MTETAANGIASDGKQSSGGHGEGGEQGGDDKEAWRVQLFRSIDGTSAASFRQGDPTFTTKLGLINFSGQAVDDSVERAYIHAIRRAQRFIYIENQVGTGEGGKKGRAGRDGAIKLR